MKGAIFYASRFGSTAQYARWIGEATGLPVYAIDDPDVRPADYDFLILGSALIFYRLIFRQWVKANLQALQGRSKVLFSVSGAGASAKLDRWVGASLPANFLSEMEHVALRGRMDPKKLPWGLRLLMKIGAFFNPDRAAAREEREGFDYVDKEAIKPIVQLIRELQSKSQKVLTYA